MNNLTQITNFLKYLTLHGVSPKSLKYYKSDLVNFLNWAEGRKVTSTLIQEYINSIRLITPSSTLNRRLSTLRSYGSFMGFKKTAKSWQDGILSRFEHKPKLRSGLHKLFFSRPNWYRKYHSYPLANYINIAILVLFTSLAGYALYDQVFRTTNNSFAFPTALTRPNRYLSFQGRLTDNLGNPKTVATNMVFQLYSVSSGGTALWNSGTCSITPDQDGIFSTLLGSSCGAEIASSVFSENAAVWLGATMGADAEATPRVQIATVAYALNAETLQGFPAGTGTSTIPYINSSGSLVLANASPTIQSTSGTFAVEGVAMTLTTPTASDGIITINPDGVGTLNLTFEGAAAGVSANGFVNATNANITSGSLYGGTVASAATGYNFIDFQSGVSPTSKFSVSATGAITTASGLTIGTTSLSETTAANDSGAYLIGTFDEFSNSSSTNVQDVLDDLDAAIAANGSGDITAVGSMTSGDVFADSTADDDWLGLGASAGRIEFDDQATDEINILDANVGIGDTTPNALLDLDSTATTTNIFGILSTTLTTGEIADITATYTPTDGSTNEAIDINLTHSPTTLADNFHGINLATTDDTALNNTIYGFRNVITLTGNAAKTGIGLSSSLSSSSTTADTLIGLDTDTTVTGIITTGTRSIYGARIQPTAGAESTGGTTNVYGEYIKTSADVGAGGTVNGYGLYIANGTFDTDGTSTNTGLYVESPTGADTNYAAIFAGGNVGIGDTSPDAFLEVLGTTEQLRLTYTDGTVDSRFTVDSSGNLTIDNTGTKTIVADDLEITGGNIISATTFDSTLTTTGNLTSNANTTIGNANTDTLTINAGVSGTGISFGDSSFTTCTALETIAGVLTCGTDDGGSTLKWNGLTVPDGNLTLAMDADTTTFNWDTLTTGTGWTAASTSLSSGTLESLSVNSTAAASDTQKVLSLSTAGANATSTQTTYGLYSTNTHTGTASTNVAGYFSASGGSNNYAGIFANGSVGIGTTAPTGKLNVISTTEQLRLGYDASNYWTSTIGSTGGLTMQGVGTGGALTLSPTAGQNLNISLSTTGDLAVNTNQLYVDTSASNVGINTTAPDKALEINSATGANLRLTYNDSNGSAAEYADLSISATGDLTINPQGNFTVTTDGTGNGEVVLPNDSIGPNEILSTGQSDEACLTYEATGTTLEWQTCSTLYSNTNSSVADGSYLTVTHNLATNDLLSSAWINAQGVWKSLESSYQPAIAWEGKDTERGVYHNEVNLYQPSEETNIYTENLLESGLLFDTFEDSVKTDSANTTASITNQKGDDGSANYMTLQNRVQTGRTGLMGGQTYNTATNDNDGQAYLGSNTVNDQYYYDRTKDSSPQIQVELGIDPNWYNGVTLSVATTSAQYSQNDTITQKNPNLSTSYNGSLIKATGTDATPRTIFITIKSPTTFDWTNYQGDAATAVTITPGTAQALGSTGVSATFTATNYNVGDVFKIASWFIEAEGTTRGAKQQFPERSNIIATNSSVDIIDSDTQKLWMRFDASTDTGDYARNQGVNAVTALNGSLKIVNKSTYGLVNVDFGADSARLHSATVTYTYNGPVSLRNSNPGFTNTGTWGNVVDNTVNDVSAAVIPNHPTKEVTVSGWGYIQGDGASSGIAEIVNLPYKFNQNPLVSVSVAGFKDTTAPVSVDQCGAFATPHANTYDIRTNSFGININSDTGAAIASTRYLCYSWTATGTVSPRQYVAVGTGADGAAAGAGGVTIINETDQSAINITTSTETDNPVTKVQLLPNGNFYFGYDQACCSGYGTIIAYERLPLVTQSATYYYSLANASETYSWTPELGGETTVSLKSMFVTPGTSTLDGKSNTIYAGTNLRAVVIQEQLNGGNGLDGANDRPSVKYYTKDYISEEMVGDIRGMWPLYGSGSIANGTNNIDDVSDKASEVTAKNANGTGMTYATGVRGTAITFDGTDDYLCTDTNDDDTCDNDTDVNFTTGVFTLGSWFKTSSHTASQGRIIEKRGNAAPGYILEISSGNGNFYLNDGTNAISTTSSGGKWSDGNWHFMVAVRDSQTTAKLYIDGQLVASGSNGSLGSVTTTIQLGIGAISDGTAGAFFNGTIDEPFVTATAISAGQIKHMYEVGYRALQSHGTGLGGGAADTNQQLGMISTGTNVVGAAQPDWNNQYLYVGTNSTTLGALSKIQLNSDTNIKTYNSSANVPTGGALLIDEDVTSLGVGYNLETVGSAASGVKSMGVDNNATATSGNFVSKTYALPKNIGSAVLWISPILDASDGSNTLVVKASNDGGSNYATCTLVNTNSNPSVPEKEYACTFTTSDNDLKVKFEFARGSTKTNTYVTQYGISWLGETGFRVEQYDTNNVRLYNYSGETQNLRLNITGAGTTALANPWTDAGSYLYPTGYESLRVYDGAGSLYLAITSDDLTFGNGESISNAVDGTLALTATTTSVSGNLKVTGGNILNSAGTANIIFSGAPTTTANTLSASNWLVENTANVGQAALMVNQTKAGDLFTASASGTTKFSITNGGNVLPGADDTQDLGSTALRWANIYLGPETLHLGTSLTDEGTISYTTSSNILNFGTDSTSNGDIAFFTDDLYLDKSAGYVGIGTTAPASTLEIASAVSEFNTTFTITTTGSSSWIDEDPLGEISFYNNDASGIGAHQVGAIKLVHDGASATAVGSAMAFYTAANNTADAERMRIDGDGNVGIGTTAPAVKLEVSTTTGEMFRLTRAASTDVGYLSFRTGTTANAYIGVDNTSGNGIFNCGFSGCLSIGTVANASITFHTNNVGAPRMTIYNTGNVAVTNNLGIGTTAPDSLLSVGGVGNTSATATFNDTGRIYGLLSYASGTNSIAVYGNTSGTGSVGVAAVGAAYDFDAQGPGVNYGTTSSIRWKHDLQPIDNALSKVLSMRGLYYTWDEAHGGGHDIGMIAEEVGQYVPEIVGWDADAPGFATGMDYGHLTPVLVEAIKEQQTQIDNLALTETGDVILTGDSPSNYEVVTTTGITTRIGAFAEATVAKLKAGIGSFRQVETNLISPVANADLIIDLQPDDSQSASKLVIKGENNEEVASIDATGLITSEELIVNNDATISGTLYADKIESSRLSEIEDLLNEVESNQLLLSEAANWNTNTATDSANFSELIANNLFVTGNASITSLFVTDNFTTKNINSLTEPLSIQSLASAPLEIMAGKIIIDTDGNTKFLGNVEIAGNLKLDGNIVIANSIDPIATESAEIIEGQINTNATAGKAMLSAGLTELKIINPKTNANTLVYVTPVTSTQNKVLYVKSKDVGEFTIGFNEAIDTDVEFNWWIIELESVNQVNE